MNNAKITPSIKAFSVEIANILESENRQMGEDYTLAGLV